jgi:DNA-binding FadR family transcriptional regulator
MIRAVSAPETFRPQLRQPRLAEMVAERLRAQILDGTLADGDALPKLEELLDQFRVSQPSMREALRILETEGLISVRRGNVGGAEVHAPRTETAAYMLGLVLESKQVTLDDVGRARNEIDPVCAALCAARADRAEVVLPRLRAANDEAIATIDDPVAFAVAMSRFHEELVALSGNQTIIIVIGALQGIWAADEQAWAADCVALGEPAAGPARDERFPDRAYRQERLDEHVRVVDLIAAGDEEEVRRAVAHHAHTGVLYRNDWAASRRVDASTLRTTRLP